MEEVDDCYPEGEDERWEDIQQREPRPNLEVSRHHVPQWRQPPSLRNTERVDQQLNKMETAGDISSWT